jgi:hypothetical protein
LIARIKRMVLALDPGAAERRYRVGRSERRVVGSMDSDGTATLAGYGLSPAEGAEACGRLDAVARAAKQAGDPRSMDQLRADLFAGFLCRHWEGMTDGEVLAHLATTRPVPDQTAEPEPEPVDRPVPVPVEPTRAGVELQVPAALLLRLLTDAHATCEPRTAAAWAPVLGDIARRIGGVGVLEGERGLPAAPDGTEDPARRFARAGLRRHVQIRGRRGWGLRAVDAGTVEWTSRLGHTYRVITPPVIDVDLPGPCPDPTDPDEARPPDLHDPYPTAQTEDRPA